jgi:hypothetical protein
LGDLAALLVPAYFDDDPLRPEVRDGLHHDLEQRERAERLSLAPHLERDGASRVLTGRL